MAAPRGASKRRSVAEDDGGVSAAKAKIAGALSKAVDAAAEDGLRGLLGEHDDSFDIGRPADAPTRAELVAAATTVAREVNEAWLNSADLDSTGRPMAPAMHELEISPAMVAVSALLDDGNWRKLNMTAGSRLFWKGEVRSSAKGDLLFGFKPQRSEIAGRSVKTVEIAYSDLVKNHKVVNSENFIAWLTNELGAPVEDLLRDALAISTSSEIELAAKRPADVEPSVDETTTPGWGMWG